MDRNNIIGIALILGILIGYSIWMMPSEEEKAALQRKQDSIAQVQRTQDSIRTIQLEAQLKADSIKKTEEVAVETSNITETSSSVLDVNRDKLGVFANSSVGEDKIYWLESDRHKIGVSAKGGKVVSVQLKRYQTYDSLPLNLFNPEKTNFGLTFFANNRIINTNELYFQPGSLKE